MFIYKITNTVNNKIYIGQTIRPIQDRLKRHFNDAENNTIDTHFARAIRKHGRNSFVIDLIDIANSQEELTLKEQYWIRFYNSTNPQIGYNETDALYKCGGNTYKSKSKEELNQISAKIRASKQGSKNPNSKRIKCFNVETNEELVFETAKDCQDFFGEHTHRFITTRTTHKINGLYRNKWKISYIDDSYDDYVPEYHKSGTTILVTNLDNMQSQVFDSVRFAARNLNIPRSTIAKRINDGKQSFVLLNYKFTILD